MSIRAVLLPVFVQVILTFVLLLWMGSMRVAAVRSGRVRTDDIALREPNWPRRLLQVQYAFHNQLELPLLFYILTILAWTTRLADTLFVAMAWLFVAFRIAHAYIHVTGNDVPRRGLTFMAGAVVLMAMWVIFMIRILVAV